MIPTPVAPRTATFFDRLEVALAAYDPTVEFNTKTTTHVKAKCKWTSKVALQCLIRAVKRQVRLFFQDIVEEMWLLLMKDAATYYKKLTLRQMQVHLTDSSGGLKATDIVGL